jgi:hypothetical protein
LVEAGTSKGLGTFLGSADANGFGFGVSEGCPKVDPDVPLANGFAFGVSEGWPNVEPDVPLANGFGLSPLPLANGFALGGCEG